MFELIPDEPPPPEQLTIKKINRSKEKKLVKFINIEEYKVKKAKKKIEF